MVRTNIYNTEVFLPFVNSLENPKSTKQIKDELVQNNDIPSISWNTVQKYLEKLEEQGKIKRIRTLRENLWYKPGK